jgi:serine/threonine protein kinase
MHREEFYGPEGDWCSVGVVMYEKMMGNHPFINPNDIFSKVLRYPSNFSINATSILDGVSIIFYFNLYFNYAQVVVVVGFTTLYRNDKTWYTVPHTGM